MIAVSSAEPRISSKTFAVTAAFIVLLSFVLREQFVLFSQVEFPIRGDIVDYVNYAYNLANFGTFSSADPGALKPLPDSFRGPGFPLLVSATMLLRPQGDAWFSLALQMQALMGAATVGLTMAVGRRWLSRLATLGSGLVVAVMPHHIAATGALLSEVSFGFVLMLAVWLSSKATQRQSISWSISAGLAFGYAYLVNPLILFFPLLVALVVVRQNSRMAACLAIVPLLVAGIWAARNHSLPDSATPGRAAINFVQGSWPEMHVAYVFRNSDPKAARIMSSIDEETQLISAHPGLGLRKIALRMRKDPGYYAGWYFIRKPFLLWDWDIRIGSGDVYVLDVQGSPLDNNPALRLIKSTFQRLNLALFLVSSIAAWVIVWRRSLAASQHYAPYLVAMLCIYVTVVHTIFQAEPRYAIPYRPFEALLFVTGLVYLSNKLSGKAAAAGGGT